MFNRGMYSRKYTKDGVEKEVSFEAISGVGNLTNDIPEIREVEVGGEIKKVLSNWNFSIAFNQGKDKEPVYLRLVAWDKQAELLKQYASKGKKLYVFGKVVTKTNEKDGKTYSHEELIIQNFSIVSPKDGGATTQSESQGTSPEGFEEQDFDDIPF